MKKLLLAAALTGVTTGAFAQGTVFFNNNSITQPAIDHNNTITLAPAGQFGVALYWLNQSSGAYTPINPATATPIASMIGNANGGFDYGRAVTIPGQSAGGVGEFEVAAWFGSQYSTYLQALDAGEPVAWSQPFYNSTGGNGTPAAIAQQLTGWAGQPDLVLKLVPEPTTISLGGLGAAALLLVRRRK